LKLIVADDYKDLSRHALAWLRGALAGIDIPTVVLPTGNTPLGLYHNLATGSNGRFLANARFLQLDEYQGIPREDFRTLAGWFWRILLSPLSIPKTALISFDSSAGDPDREAVRMEAVATKTDIDACVLGLGLNGHLGFNEPGSDFASQTRVVELSADSIKSNAAYWGDEALVPRRAFTLGLGTLAASRHTLLLVSGPRKASILATTLLGPQTPEVPATCLASFRDATVIADRSAIGAMPRDRSRHPSN
jgi:glucosamine-6-phosphate deaminase